MCRIKVFAFFNLIMVIICYSWIYFMDRFKVYGISLADIYIQYDSLLSPASYSLSIWNAVAVSTLAMLCYQYMGTMTKYRDKENLDNIKNMGSLLIINLILLSVYTTLKLHAYTLSPLLVTVLLYINLEWIHLKLQTSKKTKVGIASFYARVCFSLYSGWVIAALGFNTAIYLKYNLQMNSDQQLYTTAILAISICTALVFYKLFSQNLPSTGVSYTWALAAIYFNIIHKPLVHIHFSYFILVLTGLTFIATLYAFYRVYAHTENKQLEYEEVSITP